MLNQRHLATIGAALLFWQEEMHDEDLMRPYLEPADTEPLSSDEVAELRQLLANATVRYALFDRDSGWLADTELFGSVEEAAASICQDNQPVAVLLPRK